MRRLLSGLVFAVAALCAATPSWADSTVSGLSTLTTSPIPALSCLYVDQGPGSDTKLCAGSPLGDSLAHAFNSLALSDNLSDLQNAATARSNLGAVGLADTQTLTNKTISGTSNTLSNIGNSSLVNSSLTIGSTSVSLGGTAATLAGLTLTAPTITGAASFTGVPVFSGLSTGTQVSCLGLTSGNALALSASACGAGGGGGTVTSVGLTVPSWLNVSGSPVTGSGTLAVSAASEPAAEFLASPTGASGAMSPRTIATGDLPQIPLSTGVTGNLPFANFPAITGPTILGRVTNTSGAPSAAYTPSNGTDTTVALVHGATVSGHCPEFNDSIGTLVDTGAACGGSGSWVVPHTIDASAQSGSDMCAKISNAIIALDGSLSGITGGIVDARNFTGVQTCAGQMFAGAPSNRGYDVILGPVRIETNVPQCVANYDSLLGTTQYPNFASDAGTIIEASNSYTDISYVTSASTSSGRVLPFSNTTGLVQGMAVTGTNILPYSLIDSITANTSVTLTESITGTVASGATINFVPAVVQMGCQPNVNTFHVHIANIAAACVAPNGSMPPGCIDFQDLWAQEGSYFRNTYAGIAQVEYDLEGLSSSSVNPQNIAPWVDLYAQNLATTTGLDLANAQCIHVGNTNFLIQVQGIIDKSSCSGSSSTTKNLIMLNGMGIELDDTHMESAMNGVLVGNLKFSHGITMKNMSCGTGLATGSGQACVELSSAAGSDGVSIFGLGADVSTDMVKDDQSGGCTINSSGTGGSFTGITYIRGGNGTSPVLKGLYGGC